MIEATVKGLKDAVAKLNALGKKQLPYARALALNKTAFDCRQALVDDLPNIFTVRRKWTESGMRVFPAKKTTDFVGVGSTRAYMKKQAEGGRQRGLRKSLAVPLGSRPFKAYDVKRSQWPAALAKKKSFYIAKTKHGSWGVWFNKKRGKRFIGPAEAPKLMWVFRRRITLRRLWPLEKTVRRVVARRWIPNATAALKQAIATAK